MLAASRRRAEEARLISEEFTGVVTALRQAGCVFAEDEAGLLISTARTPAELSDMVARRADGAPLEQVLGWAGFCGLRIAVEPGVFVPRRRTECLARRAAAFAREVAARSGGLPVVLDLCCGSGAVGAAVAAAVSGVELHAADLDPAAARCARRNLAAASASVHEGDLFDPLPAALRGRVDVLAANVPYVPSGQLRLLPPEARLHEPPVALDGGADGLDVARRVAAQAPAWLAPGGRLLIESSDGQAPLAAEAFRRAGLAAEVADCGDWDAAVVIGTLPA